MNDIKDMFLDEILSLYEHIGYLQMKGQRPIPNRDLEDGLVIRKATSENDIKEALRIHRLSSDIPPSEDRVKRLYQNFGEHLFFIAEKENKLVGYCFFKVVPFMTFKGLSKKAFLFLLGVDPGNRGQRIANLMLSNSFCILRNYGVRKVYLNVGRNNIPARKLYHKNGFKRSNVKKGSECYRME